jgi:hypothetical protein
VLRAIDHADGGHPPGTLLLFALCRRPRAVVDLVVALLAAPTETLSARHRASLTRGSLRDSPAARSPPPRSSAR